MCHRALLVHVSLALLRILLYVNVLYLSKGTCVIVVCIYTWEEKESLWVKIGFDLAFDPHVVGRVRPLGIDLPLSFDIHVCGEGQTLQPLIYRWVGSSNLGHNVQAWAFCKFDPFLKDSDFILENYIWSNFQAQPILDIAVKIIYSNLLGNS